MLRRSLYRQFTNQFKSATNQSINPYTRHLTTTNSIEMSKKWLKDKGYSSESIATIVNSFDQRNIGSTLSVSLLEKLGEVGVASYYSALMRQKQPSMPADNNINKYINVHFRPPRTSGNNTSNMLTIKARVNESLQDCIQNNPQLASYLECACGGIAACSTCHVYVDAPWISKVNTMEEAEQDMVDLAANVADNSRLGCQVILSESCDGIVFEIPSTHNNLYAR
jgi:ferredoxin